MTRKNTLRECEETPIKKWFELTYYFKQTYLHMRVELTLPALWAMAANYEGGALPVLELQKQLLIALEGVAWPDIYGWRSRSVISVWLTIFVVIAWPRTRWNLRSSTIELLKLPALREEMMQLAEWSLDYFYFALCEKVVWIIKSPKVPGCEIWNMFLSVLFLRRLIFQRRLQLLQQRRPGRTLNCLCKKSCISK